MEEKIILCDVDDVLAGLLAEWIRRYNAMSGDNLDAEEVKGWNVAEFALPGWEERLYRILDEPDLYDSIAPIEGALDGVRQLRELGRVVFLTSCTAGAATHKLNWLSRHGFVPAAGSHRLRDVVIAHDKGLVYGDVLVDDGLHNVAAFSGPSVLVDKPHNRAEAHARRARSWPEIVRHVREVLS